MRNDSQLDQLIDRIIDRVGKRIVVGLPLGLGKPNRLINALYRHACDDSSVHLEIVTALSLDIPQPQHWLEERLMTPIIERLFGNDYPRLAYLADLKSHGLPQNVQVSEFYFQSGAALGNAGMQRRYIASNYTHVARDLMDRGVNLIFQLVARDAKGRLSLSCNPDVSLDLMRRVSDERDYTLCSVAHIHPNLPFMHGDAVVDPDYFDEVIDEDPAQPLFALPRQSIQLQDYAVGFHASRLIADGGTLQIGIGSLSDALVHSLMLRHRDNAVYQDIITALGQDTLRGVGNDQPFKQGLYGASEMFMDGFMHLYHAGILKREVFDDLAVMRQANAGEPVEDAGQGVIMEGGFFLGSQPFYDFLNGLDDEERPRFRMHGVRRINQLYGGNETLEIEQRRHARFVNTTMMMTATGAAVSDGLKDYQVVSGVGGQYNFVAMAHAMDDGRSVLMLRATREKNSRTSSNIVWDYPHNTIPRHLRDLMVTEYGAANLRGKTDEECIQAMIAISDARFQDELADKAKSAGKLDSNWSIPASARGNTPERVKAAFGPFVQRDIFPDYPFGSDFTEIEQCLIPALEQLKSMAGNKWDLLRATLRGRPQQFGAELDRLGLAHPDNIRERLYARLVAAILQGRR